VIGEEAARLGRLVQDLLDLARLEARRFDVRIEQVDLRALLEHGAQARAAAAQEAGVELIVSVADAPVVAADGDRVLQVVSNLLENALRWTPPGGVVRLSARPEAGVARVEVADSGPGVPTEKRDQVLRPFYSEGHSGTGLGLAIAAELLSAMQGTLSIGDAPEGGALFTCVLPRPSRHGGVPGARPAPEARAARAAP
jgi:signal transduction histidine kinase